MIKKLKCILLIDDSELSTFYHKFILEKVQCTEQIISFQNGKEALNYMINCSQKGETLPELIFLDINMPVMDGWQFLEEFKQFKSNHKVVTIMLSSSVLLNDKVRALKYDFVRDYITKPLKEENVNEILSQHFPPLIGIYNLNKN